MLEKFFSELSSYYGRNNIEVEIRFKDINNRTFDRVLQELEKKYEYKQIYSTDYIIGSERRTSITNNDKEEIYIITKDRLYIKDVSEYGLRIAVSEENSILSPTGQNGPTSPRKATTTRAKYRKSFKLNDSIQADLTRVISSDKDGTKTIYEIELEIIGTFTKEKLYLLNEQSEEMIKLIQNTVHIYTIEQKQTIIKYINGILKGSNRSDAIEYGFLVQARNLKLRDFVKGGLVGGEINYTVTVKAEGIRQLVVFHESGIWMVYPPNEACLLKPAPIFGEKALKSSNKFNGTILDGEDILYHHIKKDKQDNRLIKRHLYLAFDILSDNGNIGIQNLNHFDRMKKVIEIIEFKDGIFMKPNTFFNFGYKSFISLGNNIRDFYQAIKDIEQESKDVDYLNDGFIFTPNNCPYNVSSTDKNGLTKSPAICKWKPFDQLTIDLGVSFTPTKNPSKDVYTSTDKFRGTIFYPFDPETQIVWDHPLFESINNETVVEFAPFIDNGIIKLKPVRIRSDKPKPNRKDIAEDVWDDINRPLTKETLEGKSLALAIRYHTSIKSQLIDSIPEKSLIIDIGSGRGGDIAKFRKRKFTKMLAIEPSSDHIIEYKRRLEKYEDIKDKVKVINCGGENSNLIREEAKKFLSNGELHITMMLSLSFFWTDMLMLKGLKETLSGLSKDYGGKVTFHFLTINGEPVRNLFKKDKIVKLGEAIISYLNDSTIKIHIEDSIVQDQIEGLVNLDDLSDILKITNLEKANKDDFMSEDELIYTDLYVYGKAEIVEKNILKNIKMETELVLNVSNDSHISTNERDMAMRGDDLSEKFSPPFVKINCIKNGGSIFHCILKATNKEYQENGSYISRMNMVKELRESILKNIKEKGLFETIGDGFLLESFETIENISWISSNIELPFDYLLWIADYFSLNFYVYRYEDGGSWYTITTDIKDSKTIIIKESSDRTFDLIGLLHNTNLIQTLFNNTDSEIEKERLKKLKIFK